MADGSMREIDKAIGLTGILISYILMFYFFGLISFVLLILVVPWIASPFLILILNRLEDHIFPERVALRKSMNLNREQYLDIRENGEKMLMIKIKQLITREDKDNE